MSRSDSVTRAVARNRIAELDLEIKALESSLEERRLERKLIRESLASYKYPVLTLPAEITSEIFTRFLPTDPERADLVGPSSPSLLLQICRQWRDVALATPRLWSTVRLDMSHPRLHVQQNHLLDLWMQRSGDCPISIAMVYTRAFRTTPIEFVAELVQTLVRQISRWKEMELRLPYASLQGMSGSMPLLSSLIIGPVRSEESFDTTPSETALTCFMETPNLKTVVLLPYFNPFRITLPWSQITCLTASLWPDEAAEILRNSSALEILNLSVCTGVGSDTPISLIPALPSLHSLHLYPIFNSEETGSIQQLLQMLILPSLESITVKESFLGPNSIATLSALRPTGYPHKIKIRYAHTSRAVYEEAFPDADLSIDALHAFPYYSDSE